MSLRGPQPASKIDRFWILVDQRGEDQCWPWKGTIQGNGFASFYCNDKKNQIVAARFAYELLVGPVPENKKLGSTCNNRACVNPKHHRIGFRISEHSGQARLTTKKVIKIRRLLEDGETVINVARKYKVASSTISNIKNNTTWKYAYETAP